MIFGLNMFASHTFGGIPESVDFKQWYTICPGSISWPEANYVDTTWDSAPAGVGDWIQPSRAGGTWDSIPKPTNGWDELKSEEGKISRCK